MMTVVTMNIAVRCSEGPLDEAQLKRVLDKVSEQSSRFSYFKNIPVGSVWVEFHPHSLEDHVPQEDYDEMPPEDMGGVSG
jgi:hypothetical protein